MTFFSRLFLHHLTRRYSGQGRVIRNRQFHVHQLKQRPQKPFGMAVRQVKHFLLSEWQSHYTAFVPHIAWGHWLSTG